MKNTSTLNLNLRNLQMICILLFCSSSVIIGQQPLVKEGESFIDMVDNPENQFSADSGYFTDERDNHVYRWVRIGNQIWIAENLAYLPLVVPAKIQSNYEASCYYVYDNEGTSIGVARSTDNYATYGVLYNWRAAVNATEGSAENPSGLQGICPSGWHMPSNGEWTELIDYLGGNKIAGIKLKKEGTSYWKNQDEETTNESGFSALPGGYLSTGFYTGIGYTGFWWSATNYSPIRAWGFCMSNKNARITITNDYKEHGFSIRCVKDP